MRIKQSLRWHHMLLALGLGFSLTTSALASPTSVSDPYAFAMYDAAQHPLFCQNYVPGTLQTLTHGQVQGVLENEVQSYYHIPYASAPVGKLRFHSALAPKPWTNVLDATKAGPDALQPSVGADGVLSARGSENALNFNLFRPDNNDTGLPILVFIHGGNNQGGSAQDILAQNLVKNGNVIVVSLNYRLGLLGFNPLPALRNSLLKEGDVNAASGNFTLTDFKAALDFIKANAFAFGGNPENITISGFSAGGRDVMAMLISPMFKDSFNKAISFSGGMTTADPELSAKVVAKALAPLYVKSGYAKDEDSAFKELLEPKNDKVLKFLYSVDAAKLATTFGDAGIRMANFPHLFADGHVLPQNGFDTTNYNNVPLIMLTGSHEFAPFASGDPMFSDGIKEKRFEHDKQFEAEFAFAVDYGSKLYGYFNAQESAERMFDSYKAPIYTVEIRYGDNPEVVGQEMSQLVGATHGIFLPFLCDAPCGPAAQYPESFNNDGAEELTNSFTSYIANFLWSDNPNGKNLFLKTDLPKWHPWTSKTSGPTDLILDANKSNEIIYQSQERYQYDAILDAIEKDTRLDSYNPQLKSTIIKSVLNGRWFSNGLDQHFKNESLWPQTNDSGDTPKVSSDSGTNAATPSSALDGTKTE